jgi:hypothetical protein
MHQHNLSYPWTLPLHPIRKLHPTRRRFAHPAAQSHRLHLPSGSTRSTPRSRCRSRPSAASGNSGSCWRGASQRIAEPVRRVREGRAWSKPSRCPEAPLSPLNSESICVIQLVERPHVGAAQIEPGRPVLPPEDDRLTLMELVERRCRVPHEHCKTIDGASVGRLAPVPDPRNANAVLLPRLHAPLRPVLRFLVPQ